MEHATLPESREALRVDPYLSLRFIQLDDSVEFDGDGVVQAQAFDACGLVQDRGVHPQVDR